MTEEAQETPAVQPPHSWLKLVGALSVLGCMAVVGVMLIRGYVTTRPMNLLGVTQAAAADIEEVLVANRVPRDAITIRGPERQEHPKAHWYAYEFDVRLPASVSPSGLEQVIQQRMRSESMNLGVADYFDAGRKQGISLTYGDVGFATVRLTPSVPEPPRAEVMPDEAPDEQSEPPAPAFIYGGVAAEPEPDAEERDQIARATAPTTPEILMEIEPREDRPWQPTPTASPQTKTAGARLAIILDDGGYGGPITEAVLALPPQLTLAILPYTPACTETATRAAELGFEVMLHMPMENSDPKLYPHEGQLLVDMSEDAIAELTQNALDQIPHAKGINNHMGSRFTGDPMAMARFMAVVAKKPLFFIDSRTSADTKAYALAKTFGLHAEERDIFLDHVDEEEAIRRSFAQAVDLAKTEGSAIAIGHFRKLTVALLQELLPTLADEGVQLVHVSELIP